MAYGFYKKGKKVIKITGNPRSKTNQKNLVVWAPTKKGLKEWAKKWGTKKQKEKILK